MTKPKLIICGHGRHGKDTMAEYLHEHYKFKHESSSYACLDLFIYESIKDKYGYTTREECFEDRVNYRKEWFDLITAYCLEFPSKLTEHIFKTSDCYVGMRSAREFKASKHLADVTVWVDRSKHLPPEDESSNEITAEMCDVVIDNNDSLEQFYSRIDHFLMYKLELL